MGPPYILVNSLLFLRITRSIIFFSERHIKGKKYILTLILRFEIEVDRKRIDGIGDGRRWMADNTGRLRGGGGGDNRSNRRWWIRGGDAVGVGDGRGNRRRGRDGGRRDGCGRQCGRRRGLLVATAFLCLFLNLDLVEDRRRRRRRCRRSTLHFHARGPFSHLRATTLIKFS